VGASLLWKNAQKKLKNSITSLTINNPNPLRKIFLSYEVEPPTAHSLIKSLNQPIDTPATARIAKVTPKAHWPVFIPKSNAAGNAEAAILPSRGQGLKPKTKYTI